ncbi:hypothetical protein JCM8097_006560 [Rhodosporidiobolus ruineniae]
MSNEARAPPPARSASPPSEPRHAEQPVQHSLEHTPEPDAHSEHSHEGGRGEGDDERDELEDEADEAASTSTGRARSPDATMAASTSASDGGATLVGEASSSRAVPQAPGTKTQAAFVHKLYSMLETPSLSHLISWSEDGKSFIIYHPSEFARLVLPQYFKHANFSSFIRQGNFYHFSKISDVPGTPAKTIHLNADGTPVQTWEFRNPNFQRGRPDLLARIKRKTAKSNSNPSPSTVKRRSSVSTLASLRPGGRLESVVSSEQEYEREREEQQRERQVIGGLAGAAMAARGVTRPPLRSEYSNSSVVEEAPPPPPPKRIAPGLADFAPYPSEEHRRVKEEPMEPQTNTRSPPHPRHAVPLPSGAAYPPSNPAYSPGTRSYHLPPTAPYPGMRYSHATEDPYARQVYSLESQVRQLGEALYHTQHEFAVYRTSAYGVLHSMLGLVASMDPEGRRKEEVEACSFALAKLSPEASPTQNPHSTFPYPPPYGAHPSWSAYPFGAPPPSSLLHSPRPSTSASQQFYYNRVPAVESYTRSSRPEPAPPSSSSHPHHQHPAESRPSSAAHHAYPPSAPTSHGSSSSGTPSFDPSFSKPSQPAAAPSSNALPPLARPPSSGPPSHPFASTQQAYPSPRLSWAGGGPGAGAPGSRPGSRGGDAAGGKAGTTLPPLSSLLNPAGPPVSAERRGAEETDDERARKKLRQ